MVSGLVGIYVTNSTRVEERVMYSDFVFPCIYIFFDSGAFAQEIIIGVRAGGARGAAAPPNFGQLSFFGQQEKIWAKPGFKDVSLFF